MKIQKLYSIILLLLAILIWVGISLFQGWGIADGLLVFAVVFSLLMGLYYLSRKLARLSLKLVKK